MADAYYEAQVMACRIRSLLLSAVLILSLLALLMVSLWFLLGSFPNSVMALLRLVQDSFTR